MRIGRGSSWWDLRSLLVDLAAGHLQSPEVLEKKVPLEVLP